MTDSIQSNEYKEISLYLQERSLSAQDMEQLGWQVMGQSAALRTLRCSAAHFPFSACLYIPTGPQSAEAAGGAHPIRPAGQCVAPRALEIERASFGGADSTIANKRNTPGPQHLYVPPDLDTRTDYRDRAIYICESAVKAAALWLRGYRAVAGAGVASVWTASRGWITGWRVVDDLINTGAVDSIRVLFDSDIESNPDVANAARRIYTAARQAYRCDAGVVVLSEAEHGPKVGIDDILARLPDEAARVDYLALLLDDDNVTTLTSRADEIRAQLNDEYLLVVEPECIIRKRTGYITQPAQLKMITGQLNYTLIGEGGRATRVDALDDWMRWEGVEVVKAIDYRPGGPEIKLGRDDGYYNLWRDDGCDSRPFPDDASADGLAGVQPFLDVYTNAMGREALSAFLDAMAHIMQHRGGAKLPRTLCAVGAGQGTGKSALAELMGSILGQSNYASIHAQDLVGDFNAIFATSELVLMDDVDRMSSRQVAALKRYATDAKIAVNEKYTKAYTITNHMVFFLTANKLQALPIEVGDRRAQVLLFEPRVKYAPGSQHWLDYFAWLEHGGREAVRYHLEHRDITNLNIYAPVESEGKDRIIAGGLSDVDAWCELVCEDIDEAIGDGPRVITSEEAWRLIYGEDTMHTPGDIQRLGGELRQHFSKAHNGRQVRVNGKLQRFFALEPHPEGDWTPARVQAERKRAGG